MIKLRILVGLILIGVLVIELCAALEGAPYINWGRICLPTILGYIGVIK